MKNIGMKNIGMKNIGMKKNMNEQREGIWGESIESIKNLKNLKSLMRNFSNLVNLVKLVMQIFYKGSYSAVRAMSVQQPTNFQRISNLSPTVRPTYNRFTTNSVLSRLCLVSLILMSVGVGDVLGETCYLFQHLDEENVKTKSGNTAIYTTPDLGNVDGIDTIRFEYKMSSDWAKKMKVRYSTDGINFTDFSGSDKKSMDNKWRGRTGDFGNNNEDVYVLVPESLRTSIKKVQFAVYESSVGEYTYYVRRVQISRCPTIKINDAASQSSTFSQTAVGGSKSQTFTISTWNINTTPTVTRTTGSTFFSAELSSPTDDCPKTRTLTITYSPTSEAYADHDPANHSASFTISAGGKTATLNVTGTAREIADVTYTWNNSAPYFVGDVIDLSEAWTSSNVEESPVYSITSFTDPTGANNEGATAPTIVDGHYLHLNQACDVTLAVHQDAMTGYAEGNDTKTITVSKHTPTFTWNTSANYYYNTTISPFVTKTSGGTYTVTSDNTEVVSTSGDNVIIYNKSGTASIRVLHPETYYWNEYDHSESITPGWKNNQLPIISLTSANISTYEVSKSAEYVDWFENVEDGHTQKGYIMGRGGAYNTSNEAIIGFTGIPDSMFFDVHIEKYAGFLPSDGERECKIYESSNNSTYTLVGDYSEKVEWKEGLKAKLKSNTRFIKFVYNGTIKCHFNNIRITKREEFRTNKASLDFDTNLKGSSPAAQTFKFYHASAGYITSVTSNDAHFTVTPSSVSTGGEVCDSAVITVNYLTTEAGSHSGRITITDNIGNSTYVTVTGVTQDKLATHWEYIGTNSYAVNAGDMNATSLFRVRDANNDIVASPVITLRSNAPSVIGTVSENTAIDFLCGGSATITASYAGDETTYAAANDTTVTITVNKLNDVITWTVGQDADHKIHVWADSPIPSTIARSNANTITYTSNNAERLSVTDGTTLRALAHGEVTLTAHSAGDCTYSALDSVKTIVVDSCDHRIVWDQSFMGLATRSDLTMDTTITLTAYAVDSSDVKTGKAITYRLEGADLSNVEIDGNKLHITGTCDDVTLVASTSVDSKYAVATSTKGIRVRTYGAACGTEVIDVTGTGERHCVSGYTNKKGFTYNIGPSDKIFVKVGRESSITCDSIKFIGYDANNIETLIKGYDPSELTNEGEDKEIDLDEKYRKILIIARGETGADWGPNGGTQYKWFSNLHIRQASYLRSSVSEISENRVHVYDEFSETFTISYSDKPVIQYSYSGSVLTLTPNQEINNDCGDYGTYSFTLSGRFTRARNYDETITFTTTAGDELTIPVHIEVSTGGVFDFDVSSGEWGTSDKWKYGGGTEHNKVPDADDHVNIYKPIVISGEVEAYQVNIQSGGSVTIQPGGGLTVGAGGVVGATTSNFILKADNDPESATVGQTGYLRISPDYTGDMPNATVEMYSIVHYNTALTGDSAATYQCVGAPIEGVRANTVFPAGSYLYTWDESAGWVNSRTKYTLEAFKGFEITQKKNAAGFEFDYAGQLLSVNEARTVDLDFTSTQRGYNLLANSFTAPINIENFLSSDFIKANKTIYILNAGTKADSDGQKGDYDAPGKWVGIPIKTATLLADEGFPTMIPAMQGFWIKATDTGAQLTLDYSRLVWNVNYDEIRINKPLRAPKRITEELKTPITGKLKMNLYSDKEKDFLFILESEEYDAIYEDGYDAKKIKSGGMDIFTIEEEEFLSVDATNSIIGTRIGVHTGEETAYTLVFSHVKSESDLVLWDIDAEEQVTISEGQTYTFFAEPNSEITSRFVILEAEAPSVATGVENEPTSDSSLKGRAKKFVKDDMIYILKNGVIYDVTGKRVR